MKFSDLFKKKKKKEIPKPHDKTFEDLIETQYKHDLKILELIKDKPSFLKTNKEEQCSYYLIEHIKKRYANGCPSPLFSEVSKNLQTQYQIIHNRIHRILDELKWDYDIGMMDKKW